MNTKYKNIIIENFRNKIVKVNNKLFLKDDKHKNIVSECYLDRKNKLVYKLKGAEVLYLSKKNNRSSLFRQVSPSLVPIVVSSSILPITPSLLDNDKKLNDIKMIKNEIKRIVIEEVKKVKKLILLIKNKRIEESLNMVEGRITSRLLDILQKSSDDLNYRFLLILNKCIDLGLDSVDRDNIYRYMTLLVNICNGRYEKLILM
jgi:hypothetical protein